ncbi:MAG TPA: tetratricopeptide repeat protein [Terriglobales bacterium]|nr:tetratricopeptide repeat protein [Terriglobales bacterium]
MFLSRQKFLLACFILAFALVPCFAQVGVMQQPGGVMGTQFPAVYPQASPNAQQRMGGSITGSVRTLSNKPVSNARVEIIALAQGQPVVTEYTGANGSFAVSALPPGNYELRAQSGVLEASERVQVDDGQTWVTLRMPEPSAQGGNANAPTISVQQLRVPDKAASFLRKAQEALDKNRLDEASKQVSKALASYPRYAQALAMRGILELQQGQFEQAADDANRAIQFDPNYGTGYLVMGAALNAQKKFQEALRPLSRAEVLVPNAWQGYFESSKALLHLGRFQEALQQVNKAFTLVDLSEHPELHVIKGYAYMALRVYSPALAEFQAYLKQVPNGPYTVAVRDTLEKIRPLAAAAVAR